MLLAVSNEGHPDHCFFQENFSETAAVAQLWVALLMSKGKNSLKNPVYKNICKVQIKINSTA